MKVILTPQAREDLDGIREPLYSRVVRRLDSLESFPQSGVEMSGPWSGYRGFVVGLYRVVYRIRSDEALYIAYIRDCRRKPLV